MIANQPILPPFSCRTFIVSLFCIVICFLHVNGQDIDPSYFLPKVDFTSGAYPRALVAADLDGDGKTDFAVANYNGSSFSAFRNLSTAGNLSMASPTLFSTPSKPMAIAVGDLDGNGKPDIVTANYDINTVSVFRNISTPGAISFVAGNQFPAGINPISVFLADIDGDGRLDIVMVNNNGHNISVLRNTTTGAILQLSSNGITYPVGTWPQLGAAGDLNGDGKPDIAVPNFDDNTVSVLQNTSSAGTISFAAKMDLAAGNSPFACTIHDLDGDGKAELAVTNSNGQSISLFRNNTTGATITLLPKTDLPVAGSPLWVTVAEINGDGKPELITANFNASTVSVFQNKSTPGNLDFNPKVDFATGLFCRNVCVADIDKDGIPDLASSNSLSDDMSILLGAQPSFQTISFCPGGNVTLTTNHTGSNYQWQVNNGSGFVNVTNNANYAGATNSSLVISNIPGGWNGYKFRCLVNGSATGSTLFSLTLSTTTIPSVTISANPSGPVCSNTQVVFSSQVVNGGPAPIMEWRKNGVPVGTGTSYTASGFLNGDIITCKLISNAPCAFPATVTSNEITIQALSGSGGTISPAFAQVCEGLSQVFTASNASAYQWLLNGVPIPGATSQTYTATATGEYSVLLENNGCALPAGNKALLTIIPGPKGSIIPESATICENETAELVATGGITYQWVLNGTPIPSATGAVLLASDPGQYSVLISDNICTLEAGNISVVTAGTRLIGKNYPVLRVAAGLPYKLKSQTQGQTYSWNPATGLSDAGIMDPIITTTQNRKYFITITDPAFCPVTDTLEIIVFSKPAVYVPSGFTPNGDGKNDLLLPIPVHLKEMITFQVFNREGILVFESRNLNEGWNGKYKGAQQPTQTFVWLFRGINTDGTLVEEKGTVTLIR